jgi:hypothetical protein
LHQEFDYKAMRGHSLGMLKIVDKLRRWGRKPNPPGFEFSRPLVVLQSDDWGRVGVRDREGYEQLRANEVHLGENPYDYYSLETAEDVIALRDMLKRHRDSTGRPPCLVMNFLLANLDFQKIADTGFQNLYLTPLSQGLPGAWKRPGLFEGYRQGISDDVFYPALHGLTHFCRPAVERTLKVPGDRNNLLRTLWKAETPYIYWRMPWIGYEYHKPEKPQAGFLDAGAQANLISEAAREFQKVFSTAPLSACAPGYRANDDTHRAWSQCGVRVAQNGNGGALPPHLDECEMLNLHRNVDIEPFQRDLPLEKYIQLAERCFDRGLPAIVCTHSINFHSSLKDFRGPGLRVLDEFLSALEAKHSNLLYVHDMDLYELVNRGKFKGPRGPVSVQVKQSHGSVRHTTMGAG